MTELGFIAIGVVLTLCGMKILALIERDEVRRRRLLAESVLRRHGMSAQPYVASSGITDRELAEALEVLAASGQVVVDHCGTIVGDLCQRANAGRHLLIVSRQK